MVILDIMEEILHLMFPDINGVMWTYRKKEYDGSALVRSILISGGFFGSGVGSGLVPAQMQPRPFNRQGVNRTIRRSRRKVMVMVEENNMAPQVVQGGGSSQIIVINPLNSFIKNQLFLDLAYT